MFTGTSFLLLIIYLFCWLGKHQERSTQKGLPGTVICPRHAAKSSVYTNTYTKGSTHPPDSWAFLLLAALTAENYGIFFFDDYFFLLFCCKNSFNFTSEGLLLVPHHHHRRSLKNIWMDGWIGPLKKKRRLSTECQATNVKLLEKLCFGLREMLNNNKKKSRNCL